MGQEMLQRLDGYTAVIATNDLMAMGFIKAMRDNGLHCPEDISVLGIDNNALSAVFEPFDHDLRPRLYRIRQGNFRSAFRKERGQRGAYRRHQTLCARKHGRSASKEQIEWVSVKIFSIAFRA